MKRIVFSLMLFSFCGIYAETKEYWKLVWSEEFEYVGLPDSEKWNFEEGFRRNNEAQWYQPQNASVKNGYLTLEARRDLILQVLISLLTDSDQMQENVLLICLKGNIMLYLQI